LTFATALPIQSLPDVARRINKRKRVHGLWNGTNGRINVVTSRRQWLDCLLACLIDLIDTPVLLDDFSALP